jgi:hypothetical protein
MVAGSSSTDSSSSASAPDNKNINNDELVRKRELAFQQVLKEVGMVKEYLSWLITSSSASDGSSSGGGSDSENAATFGEVLADKKAASSSSSAGGGSVVDMVELLGGSSSTTTTSSSTSSTSTNTSSSKPSSSSSSSTEYHPTYRTNLGTTILLSGTTDTTLLSYLNNNFFGQSVLPNMNFSTIRALVQDVALAKKGAISREARYGGLLDKLVIEPLKSSSSSSSSVLPTQEELAGATSWIVQLSPPTTEGDASSSSSLVSMMKEVAQLASTSTTLTNVILMVVAPANDDDSHASSEVVEGWNAILESSTNNNFKATLLSVGELYDGGNEGGFYHIGPLSAATAIAPASTTTTTSTTSTSSSSSSKLSRKKAYQLLAHMLALDTTSQQAYVAYEYPSSDNAMMEMIASPYAEGEFAVVVRDDDESGKEVMEGVDENKDIKMTCRMIQAMRELGFTQVMELDVLVGKGIEVRTHRRLRLLTDVVLETPVLLVVVFSCVVLDPSSHPSFCLLLLR